MFSVVIYTRSKKGVSDKELRKLLEDSDSDSEFIMNEDDDQQYSSGSEEEELIVGLNQQSDHSDEESENEPGPSKRANLIMRILYHGILLLIG